MHMEMCTDMAMLMDTFTEMCRNMCADTCADTFVDMFVDMLACSAERGCVDGGNGERRTADDQGRTRTPYHKNETRAIHRRQSSQSELCRAQSVPLLYRP